MVRNFLRLVLAVKSVSKPLNRVKKIPIVCGRELLPEDFTVQVNSDMKLCVWLSDSE